MKDLHEPVILDIQGMTCASCVSHVEKKLNAIDGVQATVNLVTARATVDLTKSVSEASLVDAVRSAGYDASSSSPTTEESEPSNGNRSRLLVALPLTVFVSAVSMIPALQFSGWPWAVLAATVPVIFYAGFPFHRSAITSARHGTSTMDTLVSLGTLSAFTWSVVALVFGNSGEDMGNMDGPHLYFEVAAVVTLFLLVGRTLEGRAQARAGAAVRNLLALGAKRVTVIDGDTEREVPVETLQTGQRFVVRPGEKVATDGVVESGTAAIDQSIMTGESLPVDVSAGSFVTGATLNTNGHLVVRATRVGAETALAQMAKLVQDAQAGKASVQRLADRISAVFVPAVLLITVATFLAWLALGADVSDGFVAAVAVLIVACPCALGLATPTALVAGTGRASQLGILIKGPVVLESVPRIDVVAFDKTGTLTTGAMLVRSVTADGAADENLALKRAGAVEAPSEHPIARAVAERARAFGPLLSASDFVNEAGAGVTATVDNTVVHVGRPEWLEEKGNTTSAELTGAVEAGRRSGSSVVGVAWEGSVRAVIAVADTVGDTAQAAVTALRGMGLQTVMLTGDHEATAQAVAGNVGVDEVFSGLSPRGKVQQIEALQGQGKRVAMVGDGVNDAAALAQADLGMAMGKGTDAAIDASDITLMSSDPSRVADAIKLARRTMRTIKSNLFWAFAYNVAAIPLAASGLLNPMIAGGAMALSSLFVVLNSLRLRAFSVDRASAPTVGR